MQIPPASVVAQGLQLRYLAGLHAAEVSGRLGLAGLGLGAVPRELGFGWDEHPELHHVTAIDWSKYADMHALAPARVCARADIGAYTYTRTGVRPCMCTGCALTRPYTTPDFDPLHRVATPPLDRVATPPLHRIATRP